MAFIAIDQAQDLVTFLKANSENFADLAALGKSEKKLSALLKEAVDANELVNEQKAAKEANAAAKKIKADYEKLKESLSAKESALAETAAQQESVAKELLAREQAIGPREEAAQAKELLNKEVEERLNIQSRLVQTEAEKNSSIRAENKELKKQITELEGSVKSLQGRIDGFLASLKG